MSRCNLCMLRLKISERCCRYGYGDPLRTKVTPEFSIRLMDESYAAENKTIAKVGCAFVYFNLLLTCLCQTTLVLAWACTTYGGSAYAVPEAAWCLCRSKMSWCATTSSSIPVTEDIRQPPSAQGTKCCA